MLLQGLSAKSSSYALLPSAFGTFGVVWQRAEAAVKVHRIQLPNERTSVEELIQEVFAGAGQGLCPPVVELCERIQTFLEGEAVDFDLGIIALERCSDFQQRVLLAEREIPRGWVSTYGKIARHLGIPGGARAVGGALARNPFPIVIPCHRAIRSDGELGGYQGGREMKRALLELEGIEVSPAGRVLTDRVYY